MSHSGRGKVRGDGDAGDGFVVAGDAVGEEVAHARARFAVDPATPARLTDAWTAPTGATEEDESELIDAVADCLSVGLPLDAAVASWRSGSLQVSERDDDDDERTDVYDDAVTGVYDRRRPTGRRRRVDS